MKRFAFACLCLALLPAPRASAEVVSNFSLTGLLEVNGEANTNIRTTANDNYRNTLNSLTLTATWDMFENAHATLTAEKNTREWGTRVYNLQTLQSSVTVYQANISFDDFMAKDLTAKIGLSYYGDPNDIIIFFGSERLMKHRATSGCDLALLNKRFTIKGLDASAEAAYIKYSEKSLTADLDLSAWLAKSSVTFASGTELGLAAYNSRTGNNSVAYTNRNLWIFDLTAKGGGKLRWSAEAAVNAGTWDSAITHNHQSRAYTGYAGKAHASYQGQIGATAVKPRVAFAYGSGDNQGRSGGGGSDKNFHGINPSFTPGYIFSNSEFLAGMTISSKPWTNGEVSNLSVWEAGVDITPTDKLSFEISGYNFWLNSLTAGTFGGQRCIGGEVDFTAKYVFSTNVTASVYAGRFFNGGFIKNVAAANGTPSNAISSLGTYLTVTF